MIFDENVTDKFDRKTNEYQGNSESGATQIAFKKLYI